MTSKHTRVGHGLAKVLGIKLDYCNETDADKVTRGESVFSVSSADTFVEQEPTVADWIRELSPTGKSVVDYFWSFFPFLHWIKFYNARWFMGDLVAGITVAAVVVPQSMAYAKLALLPPEYGLYSSFVGVIIYWLFATSKDITIGPVAVMSTITGNVITEALKVVPEYKDQPYVISSAVAVVAGAIVTAVGLARLGWIVELISLTAISAFMTGAALNIAVGQMPALMGITGFSNRDPTYQVAINVLKNIGRTKMDATMGLTALFFLYVFRYTCNVYAKRYPQRQKTLFFISTLRSALIMLLYILISFLVNRTRRSEPLFKVLGNVPRGLKHAKVPEINGKLFSSFASQLPPTVIVLLIEQIAIAKSFGRINNYTINPSQELVAVGVSNLIGPFLGAYPATGSFSRTAIQSKAGVRTPFAGVVTGLVVLLAIYALPAMFFYIPNSSLAAVIIHAVGDLITPPNVVYQFWRISPLEVFIFFAGVLVTVFCGIEEGIYVTVSISAAMLLFRVFKARGRFLGKVKIHSVVGDHVTGKDELDKYAPIPRPPREDHDPDTAVRNIFLPMDHHDGSNPQIEVEGPYPGIYIYRFSEGFNYPNANHYLDHMVSVIFKETRRTDMRVSNQPGDRPWNDPGPRGNQDACTSDARPTLKAIILDFSSVNNVDITSVQHLIDVRNQLDRYAAPDVVEWHFACISNRWTKRALAAAGFGYPTPRRCSDDASFRRWKPIFSVAELGGADSAAEVAEAEANRQAPVAKQRDLEDAICVDDGLEIVSGEGKTEGDVVLEKTLIASKAYGGGADDRAVTARIAVVHGLNRPLFHIDLTSALQSAVSNVEWRGHRKSLVK